jgi:DNA-binding ferritin-like protein (Dps family)
MGVSAGQPRTENLSENCARVRALPPDYQIVHKETQRYLFKVWPVDLLRRPGQGLA